MHRHVRRRPVAAALAIAALVLTACGSTDTPAAPTPTAPTNGDDAPAAFPVSITHKYGVTEIPKEPKRIVAAGFRDQEYMLALGVVPVGIRDWYGPDFPYDKWPWVTPALNGQPAPEIHSGFDELNLEKIASLQPDLITTVYSDVTKEIYDQLSQIAPTVAQSGDVADFTMTWQDETRVIGKALGREKQAEDLISKTENLFTDAAAQHPDFAGKTVGVLQFGDPGNFYVLNATDPKAKFFTDLGFTVPTPLTDLVGTESNVQVSFERLDLLNDLDLIVWLSAADPDTKALEEAVKSESLYQQLNSVQTHHDLFLVDGGDALAWGSPLSLPSALKDVLPQVEKAIAGH